MILYISHNVFEYEAGNLFRLFFPYEALQIVHEEDEKAQLKASLTGRTVSFSAQLSEGSGLLTEELEDGNDEKAAEFVLIRLMFSMLSKITGYHPKWGMLTGIHPVKLYGKTLKELGDSGAEEYFRDIYKVQEDKIQLCKRVLAAQDSIVKAIEPMDFSLYISIPFCPSRCSYCSFVSQSVEKSQKLIEPYLQLLLEELKETAKLVSVIGLKLVSIYIGGGTPTTLSAEQLKRLLLGLREYFDLGSCAEFTVEAGRPDTIDREKLEVIKSLGVGRISINPQSLQDNVLEAIGRRHTAADVLNSFALAREQGHKLINMDLIAGLQGDTVESFKNTLDMLLELQPENVTVHTLALKRSADIFRSDNISEYHSDKHRVEAMVQYAALSLTAAGYQPYYLYRQSRMAGNLENIGWAKPGTACAYNIYTMDESQTVIACGAGGVSKLIDPWSDRLERVFNFKYAYEYINRFPEILERKRKVSVLYGQFCQRIHKIHQPSGAD